MSDLILEFLTEEIPARMQSRACQELKTRLSQAFKDHALNIDTLSTYVTPRRLIAHVTGLPKQQPDIQEDRKGPKLGAPEQALQGFMKANNLTSLDACEIRPVGKAEFYFLAETRSGKATKDLVPDIVITLLKQFSWPKSMHWGRTAATWVRPLQSVVCIFDSQLVSFNIPDFEGLQTSQYTQGHRFLSQGSFSVHSFAQYQQDLEKSYVLLDQHKRQQIIQEELEKQASSLGYRLHQDPGLLAEVTGLVEWPVILSGKIEERFLQLPREVLTTSMRAHQKYFSLLSASDNTILAPAFLMVSNMVTQDKGAVIIGGNERVLRARLADAEFFWQQDQKTALKARLNDLENIVFHVKLGTLSEKVERLHMIAPKLASYIPNCDIEMTQQAAHLAKADLTTGMVGEFPELQGVMGQYYAAQEGYAAQVCDAIADHYKPQGPSDTCPTAAVSVAIALADKLDSLVGFFAINERPTGSKDPFALRRCALGILRLVIENNLRLSFKEILDVTLKCYPEAIRAQIKASPNPELSADEHLISEIMAFLRDRLQVMLKDQNTRHDLVQAAFSVTLSNGHQEDDFVRLLARIRALETLLQGDDGENLLAAYRRAANILRIEEQKDKCRYTEIPIPDQLTHNAEKHLFEALKAARGHIKPLLLQEAFPEIMSELARLRSPLDIFFQEVHVNDENSEIRQNRLRLLNVIRETLEEVADFSKFAG